MLTAFAISIASGSGTVVKTPTHDQGLKNIFTDVNITLTKLCLQMLTDFAINIANGSGTVVKQQTPDERL
jgi:hypothetical protein